MLFRSPAGRGKGRVHELHPRNLVGCMDFKPWWPPRQQRGQNTGVGSHSLLKGIFPTQGSNPGLPNCRGIFYQLSHQGSPRTLEWVAYPFSTGSSQPRSRTGVSFMAELLGKHDICHCFPPVKCSTICSPGSC